MWLIDWEHADAGDSVCVDSTDRDMIGNIGMSRGGAVVASVVLSLIITFVNGSVLLARFLKPNIKRTMSYFYLSFVVCDFLHGILTIPITWLTTQKERDQYHHFPCSLTSMWYVMISIAHTYNCVFIVIESFFTLRKPEIYARAHMPVAWTLAGVWATAFTFAIWPPIYSYIETYRDYDLFHCHCYYNVGWTFTRIRIYFVFFAPLCIMIPMLVYNVIKSNKYANYVETKIKERKEYFRKRLHHSLHHPWNKARPRKSFTRGLAGKGRPSMMDRHSDYDANWFKYWHEDTHVGLDQTEIDFTEEEKLEHDYLLASKTGRRALAVSCLFMIGSMPFYLSDIWSTDCLHYLNSQTNLNPTCDAIEWNKLLFLTSLLSFVCSIASPIVYLTQHYKVRREMYILYCVKHNK